MGPPTYELSTRALAHSGAGLPSVAELTVRFDWQLDRYHHQLLCGNGNGSPLKLVVSLEDDDRTEWPISAPVQQLTTCPLADRRQGLVGVGMAGTGHWSVAVEEAENSILLDVACRLTRKASRLGAAYEFDSRWRAAIVDGGAVERIDFFAAAAPQSAVWSLLVELGSASLQGKQLLIRPAELPAELPATARWRYRFVLTQPA